MFGTVGIFMVIVPCFFADGCKIEKLDYTMKNKLIDLLGNIISGSQVSVCFHYTEKLLCLSYSKK